MAECLWKVPNDQIPEFVVFRHCACFQLRSEFSAKTLQPWQSRRSLLQKSTMSNPRMLDKDLNFDNVVHPLQTIGIWY